MKYSKQQNVNEVRNIIVNDFHIAKVSDYYDKSGYLLQAPHFDEHHIFLRHDNRSHKTYLKILALNYKATSNFRLKRLYLKQFGRDSLNASNPQRVLNNLAIALEKHLALTQGSCALSLNSKSKNQVDITIDVTNVTVKSQKALINLFKLYGLKPIYN